MVMEVWHRKRGFMVENWICVIDLEYVSVGGGGRMKAAQGAYGWVLWGWDKFSWCIKYKVGDITSIKFWFRLAWNNEATFAEHLQVKDGSVYWELNFSQAIQDWKLESLSIFLDLLYSSKVDGVGVDKLCWRPSTHNEFEVRLYYRVLAPSKAK